MIERGIILNGKVEPGTERVIRDCGLSKEAALSGLKRAFWDKGERGTKRRSVVASCIIGHWTGGEAGVQSFDDDAIWAVQGTKQRVGASGAPLVAAYHFIIGACSPNDDFANIWQTCDLSLATVHVGSRSAYLKSVGIEIVNCGFPRDAQGHNTNLRNRETTMRYVAGRRVEVCKYFRGQLNSYVWLCEKLAGIKRDDLDISRFVPARNGMPLDRRFRTPELADFRGAFEHFHVPGTTKLDGGTLLTDALLRAGWQGIPFT